MYCFNSLSIKGYVNPVIKLESQFAQVAKAVAKIYLVIYLCFYSHLETLIIKKNNYFHPLNVIKLILNRNGTGPIY